MVRLVQPLIHGRVVFGAVDPVDCEVGECEEEGELEVCVCWERGCGGVEP